MIKADRVIKSKRKTLSVSVDRDGRVTVRAPYYYTDTQIKNALLESEGWINKQLKKYAEAKEMTSGFEIADGKSVMLLGEKFTVRLADVKKADTNGRTVILPESNPKEHLIKLYKTIAKNYLTERTEYLSGVTRLTPTAVKITSAKTRWGSCSAKKSVNFSFFLIMCPPDVIDYVIIHELCHIRHLDHSALFWNEVGRYIPEYKKKRKWLNDNRYIMDLI